jgi:hypothetical protein
VIKLSVVETASPFADLWWAFGLTVGAFLIFFPMIAGATPVAAEDERYQVHLAGSGESWYDPNMGSRMKFSFKVLHKTTREEALLTLDNLTTAVKDIQVVGDRLVVFGEEPTARASVITFFHLKTGQVVDTLLAYDYSLSKTGRYLAYRKFYPAQSDPPSTSALILLYDLQADPSENRLKPEKRLDPFDQMVEVGHPVYPEWNVSRKSYRVWVQDHHQRHHLISKRFAWFDEDRKLVFGEQVGDQNFLVVLDLSNGITGPEIYRMPIEPKPKLLPENGTEQAALPYVMPLSVDSIQPLDHAKVRLTVSSKTGRQSEEIELDTTPHPEDELPLDPHDGGHHDTGHHQVGKR